MHLSNSQVHALSPAKILKLVAQQQEQITQQQEQITQQQEQIVQQQEQIAKLQALVETLQAEIRRLKKLPKKPDIKPNKKPKQGESEYNSGSGRETASRVLEF